MTEEPPAIEYRRIQPFIGMDVPDISLNAEDTGRVVSPAIRILYHRGPAEIPGGGDVTPVEGWSGHYLGSLTTRCAGDFGDPDRIGRIRDTVTAITG